MTVGEGSIFECVVLSRGILIGKIINERVLTLLWDERGLWSQQFMVDGGGGGWNWERKVWLNMLDMEINDKHKYELLDHCLDRWFELPLYLFLIVH